MWVVMQGDTSFVLELRKVPKNFVKASGMTQHHWRVNQIIKGDLPEALAYAHVKRR